MLANRAFDPGFLERLDALMLSTKRARTVRAGRRTVGRILGSGLEPENFREYSTGDDLRFLDWNAFARLDDLTIRTFRAERQVELTVLIDASASMGVPQADEELAWPFPSFASADQADRLQQSGSRPQPRRRHHTLREHRSGRTPSCPNGWRCDP